MIGVQSTYAFKDFQLGFKHGVADGKLDKIVYCSTPKSPCPYPDNKYIQQPGKGFDHQTTQFVNGYIKGRCSAIGHGGGGIEANDDPMYTPGSFDCDIGLSSAYPHPKDYQVTSK
jgi:hypothetical protein